MSAVLDYLLPGQPPELIAACPVISHSCNVFAVVVVAAAVLLVVVVVLVVYFYQLCLIVVCLATKNPMQAGRLAVIIPY